MTGFSKAFSYNVKNAFAGTLPDLRIDYNMVLLSRGDLPNVELPVVSSPSSGRLQFSWTDNSGKGKAAGTDKAFVAAYNEESDFWIYQLEIATRSQGKCELPVKDRAGKSLQTYIGFLTADGKDVSDSVYTGLIDLLPN